MKTTADQYGHDCYTREDIELDGISYSLVRDTHSTWWTTTESLDAAEHEHGEYECCHTWDGCECAANAYSDWCAAQVELDEVLCRRLAILLMISAGYLDEDKSEWTPEDRVIIERTKGDCYL